MTPYEQLDLAALVSIKAHHGQFDKGGKPYWLHPFHLADQLMFDTLLAVIAILHDVVEDSEVTLEDLSAMGFEGRVITALDLLTHRKGVPYESYIRQIATNYDTIRVKRKDLKHNSCCTRLKGVTEKDHARLDKYNRAYLYLGDARAKFR